MSKNKRTENWISFQNPEGQNKIGSPSFIRKLLGVDTNEESIYRLINRMQSLENKVHRLESPQRQRQVVDLLTKEAGKSHRFNWFSNRIPNLDYRDMRSLVNDGTISEEKAGNTTMFYLTSRLNTD